MPPFLFADDALKTPKLKSVAVLIGYDSNRACVHSEVLNLDAYYDMEHVWDDAARVKRLKLKTIKGFLFAASGELQQEFETTFDLKTGKYTSDRARSVKP